MTIFPKLCASALWAMRHERQQVPARRRFARLVPSNPYKSDPKRNAWITAENIKKPSGHCLAHNIKAPRVYGIFGERSYTEGVMLTIKASDVTFDLRGFTMNVEASGKPGVRDDTVRAQWR